MPAAPVLPATPPEKQRYVRAMFSDIAPRYDLLNGVLSFRLDRAWRRRAVAALGWERRPDGVYLDACAGTLELARHLATRPGFRGLVVGMDFALPMLRLGSAKLRDEPVAVAAADTQCLPAAEGTFDGALVGFGVRNLASLEAGLSELTRVLKPGGRLVVLDFGMPKRGLMRGLYLWYFQHVLPVIGRLVSGHPTAYTYLPESVVSFPEPAGLAGALARAGLKDTGYRLMLGGAVALTWGTR